MPTSNMFDTYEYVHMLYAASIWRLRFSIATKTEDFSHVRWKQDN